MLISIRLHRVITTVCFILAATYLSGAWAQDFPSRPIRLTVTGQAGSSSDIIARKLGKIISEQTGAAVVVENKGGASGSIGLAQTIRAPADGYNLVIAVPDSLSIYPLLKKVRPYDAERELTPIAEVAETNFVFAVNAKSTAKNLADFVLMAKARPAGSVLSYASPGVGTSGRLITELLMAKGDFSMVHVPYKSTIPGLVGVAGGETDIMATSIASAKSLSDAGQIRMIGITRDKRLPGFPEIPTAKEAGFSDLDVSIWWGIFAPARLPADIQRKLTLLISNAASSMEMKEQLASLGLESRIRSGDEFRKFFAEDSSRWQSLILSANVPLED